MSDPLWLGRILWRRWRLIALVFFLGTGAAVAGLLQFATPRYVARTEILVERDSSEFSDLQHDAESRWRGVEPAEMETYVRVAGSDRVALAVLDQLRSQLTPALSTGDDESLSDRELLERFRRNVEVIRDPLAYVVTVSYTAADPDLAAEVANTIAQVFLDGLVEAQRSELTQSASYLRERVEAVADELEAAQNNASAYQNERKLYRLEDTTADELRYEELTRQLLAAQAELARAQARLAHLSVGSADVADSLVSPVVTALRAQEAEVARRLADLSSTLGERHPRMIDTAAELEEIRRNIANEQARIGAQLRSDVGVIEDRVASLRAELEVAEQKLSDNSGAAAELGALESRVATTQRTYLDLLERFQRASEQQHLLRPAARVITPALPPDSPSRKTDVLILAFAGFSFLTAGMALAVLLDLLRRGYETSEELERDLDLPVLATLPQVGKRYRTDVVQSWQADANSLEEIIYSEALQRLFVRVTGGGGGMRGNKVLLVTSSLPGEGKSTIAFSMARQVAASGARVLLIGADLRKRRALKQTGLVKVLSGEAVSFMAVVKHDGGRTNLDMLLAERSHPFPQRLLGSPSMTQLLDEARRFYDVVIIDTPPVLAFSDYAVLVPLVDMVLVVVRWQATTRRAVKVALKELTAHDAPVAGLVFNQARLDAYRQQTKSDPLSYYEATRRYYEDRDPSVVKKSRPVKQRAVNP